MFNLCKYLPNGAIMLDSVNAFKNRLDKWINSDQRRKHILVTGVNELDEDMTSFSCHALANKCKKAI